MPILIVAVLHVHVKFPIPFTASLIIFRMLEFKCLLPLQKDLKIVLKDYDLLTSDDPIGETIIDLENRYLSQYRAVCGVPQTYYT